MSRQAYTDSLAIVFRRRFILPNTPSTLNSLMKHLRDDDGVHISGSTQKRRLKNIGYYHSYKGYRFVGKAVNKLPITDFAQITALYDFDMQVKTLFYPRIISIETALKNYTLEAVLKDAKSERFEVIWQKCLTNYKSNPSKSGKYSTAWEKRQRLRSNIDGIILRTHKEKDVIRHFRDADKSIPIWAIFEVITLGEFGTFYGCLDKRVKSLIVSDIGMPTNLDSEGLLGDVIFVLKDLRNAIAHNGVVLDVRFKSGKINTGVGNLIEVQMGIKQVDFSDITDYVVLLIYLMKKMQFTKTECRQFINGYVGIVERYRSELPTTIYTQFIRTSTRNKLKAAQRFVRAS